MPPEFLLLIIMNDLRKVSIEQGLKQFELARKAGITNVQLCNIELGKNTARPATRQKMKRFWVSKWMGSVY